jgi:hypothetical protein
MPSFESYRIAEPHPSVPASSVYMTGRGGSGNACRVSSKNITPAASASGPASRAALAHGSNSSPFMTGRGGSGNFHKDSQRRVFSFDEELAEQRRIMEHQAPIYHIGRGGAGNLVHEDTPRANRQNSTASNASTDSSSSAHQGRSSLDAAWHRVSRSFSHH